MVSFIRSTPRVAAALDLLATKAAVPVTGVDRPMPAGEAHDLFVALAAGPRPRAYPMPKAMAVPIRNFTGPLCPHRDRVPCTFAREPGAAPASVLMHACRTVGHVTGFPG